MASAYVFEYVARFCSPEVRLWLPTDPPPARACPEGAGHGIFESLRDAGDRLLGPGTWIAVTGLPAGYDTVTLDGARSAGIAAVASPLSRGLCGRPETACFGITLAPGFGKRHRLAVRFTSDKGCELLAARDFDVFSVEVPELPPAPEDAGDCRKDVPAELRSIPAVVMAALLSGKRDACAKGHPVPEGVLSLAPAARGIGKLERFEPTGDTSGRLWFALEATQDDLHFLAITARCPKGGRTITAAAPAFFHQACPRVVIRGPFAGRSLPAEPPARFRIGPFEGLRAGQAELVHAAFCDLRGGKRAYKGPPWVFQLRAQPLHTATGALNRARPEPRGMAFDTTEGGELGVIIAADRQHPHMRYALVERGVIGPRCALERAGNPLLPADGTFPEIAVSVVGAGVDEHLSLPSHAVLFFLDERELTDARAGLLRALDVSPDHTGTSLVMALHVLSPCGCMSHLELDSDVRERAPLSLVGGLEIAYARPRP